MICAHWANDADLSDIKTLIKTGYMTDMKANSLLEMARTPLAQALHKNKTEEAIERSVSDPPTYFVGDDMFYGQERLELVERAFKRPFAGTWPRT